MKEGEDIRAKTKMTIAVCIMSVMCIVCTLIDESKADSPDISYFDVKIVDNEGHDSPNILSHRYVVDTITDNTGTTYILRAQISLQASPANVFIESDEGTFNCYVRVTGLSSSLKESGIRIQLTDGENEYKADLKQQNEFVSYLEGEGDSKMTLQPNTMYPMYIMTLEEASQQIPPEDVEDVVIEITAHLKDGMHQVAFFSEGEMVDAYKLADGQSIRPLPTVERDGYTFDGWFMQNGTPVEEGYVVTEQDGDIIAYARWTPVPGSSSYSMNWIILVIIAAIIIGLFIMFLYYRRRRSS